MDYFDNVVNFQMNHYDFGDKRLDKRCRLSQIKLLTAGSEKSFPQVFKNQHELKALYRFANNGLVQHDCFGKAYQRGIYEYVDRLDQSDRPPFYYLFQDSSTAKYNKRLVELGYTETGKDNGVLLHHGILTDAKFTPLGLPIQQFIVRDRATYGKSKDRAKRTFEEKESYKWIEGFDFGLKFHRKTGIKVVQVMDKEADAADIVNYALKGPYKFFIINGWHDRKLKDSTVRLVDHLHQMAHDQVVKRPILDKHGKKHILDCSICYAQLELEGINKAMNVVYLKQLEPIEGQEPAEWILLTNLKVKTLEQAEQIIDAYSHRWRTCEDFHKCLKTGCSIEKRQLDSPSALFNSIALLSLPAIALLRLRHLAQHDAQHSINDMFNQAELEVADIAAHQYLMPIDLTLCQKRTVFWMILLLGRMGGHQGFKQKGMPGWQTIWVGWKYLQTLVDGYNMSKNSFLQKPGTYG